MNRTRIARNLDVQRLAAALRSPGIDTRCWVSLAIATEDSQVDETHGVFVDVKLMPTEEPYTARVGAIYAGDAFGIYTRIRKDDELAVVIPSGNATEGVVVLARLWSQADKPPTGAPASIKDNPEDVIIVVEPEKNLRVKLTGGGQYIMDVGSNQFIVKEDKIEHGRDGARDKAVLDSLVQGQFGDVKGAIDQLTSDFNGHTHGAGSYETTIGSGGGGGPVSGDSDPPTDSSASYTIGDTASQLVTIDS